MKVDIGDIPAGEQIIVEIRFGVLGRIGMWVGTKIIRLGALIVRASAHDVRKEILR